MRWDHLDSHKPIDRRSIVAETAVERDLLIAFALFGDPGEPTRPGQDPRLYERRSLPVTFSRAVSQTALKGVREIQANAQDVVAVHASSAILDALDVWAETTKAA